ncbi:MAG: hypothetical protein ACYCYP_02070 [Leptospirales bacterium]
MARALPGSGPASGNWKGKGRLILTVVFFLGLAMLSLHPGSSVLSKHPSLIMSGPDVVMETTVRSWLGGDPYDDVFNPDGAKIWLGHHPWVEQVAFKRYLWGGGAILLRIKSPVAFLRSSSSETPGNPTSPWGKSSYLPYLLPDGRVIDGLIYPGTDLLPQIIVRAPLDTKKGLSLVSAIHLVRTCRGHGAPVGNLFVFRGHHDIRFFPDRSTSYLILPEEGHCRAFRLYERILAHPDRFSKGVGPQGYDLRFRGMLLIRPEQGAEPDSVRNGKYSLPH